MSTPAAAAAPGGSADELSSRDEPKWHYRRSLAIRIKIYGNDSTRVARAKDNLGMLLMHLKRYPEARATIADAVATLERVSGSAGADVAIARFNLAMATDKVHGRAASAPMALAAVDQVRKSLPPKSPSLKRIEDRYAGYLAQNGVR